MFDSLIDSLGGTSVVAEALGVKLPRVSNWRTRGVPADRWPALIRLAGKRRVAGVTFDKLEKMHVNSRRGAA